MSYIINLGAWRSVFAVPSCVADNYIKIASGNQLKTLLYLLKNSGAVLTAAIISSETGVPEGEVSEALDFWEERGVIAKDKGTITPANTAPISSAVPVTEDKPKPVSPRVALAETQFPPTEIASAVNGDKAVKYLFETFERLAGRPTKHAERNTLMVIIEEIKLPCEVAVMLVNYCFEIDKATPAYMKTSALDWYESGIDTIGKAEERIRALKQRNTLENKLRVKFGMNSAFSAKQKEIINGWAEMELPESLIDAAYDKTLNGAGKLSFPYMDSILRKWKEQGITDPAQLEKQKKQEASESGSSFDISELEQSAYQRYKKH